MAELAGAGDGDAAQAAPATAAAATVAAITLRHAQLEPLGKTGGE